MLKAPDASIVSGPVFDGRAVQSKVPATAVEFELVMSTTQASDADPP
jgi:hypothetical protein